MQGIFGVGGEKHGEILLLEVEPDHIVEAQDIPKDIEGKILVGGAKPDYEALHLAGERGAVGFITGSIDDQALAEYLGYDLGIALTGDEEVPMTVMVTEGFGKIPISERVLEILSKHNGMTASLNGATQVRAGALRPEVFIHVENLQEDELVDEEEVEGLNIGREIRIIRVPYFGIRGVVEELPHDPEQIETGAHTRVLRAKLEDGRVVTVPRANVELL